MEVVTVARHIGSYPEKRHAEHAAQRVSGVIAWTVEMDAMLSDQSTRSDVDIARSGENVLRWTSCLPGDHFKVMIENGCIRLTGEGNSTYQRKTAAVRHLMYVKDNSNNVAIKPRLSPSSVQSAIKPALKRPVRADAKTLSLEVHGVEVAPSGTVRPWSERELAQDLACGTQGVESVVNNLSVS